MSLQFRRRYMIQQRAGSYYISLDDSGTCYGPYPDPDLLVEHMREINNGNRILFRDLVNYFLRRESDLARLGLVLTVDGDVLELHDESSDMPVLTVRRTGRDVEVEYPDGEVGKYPLSKLTGRVIFEELLRRYVRV